MQTPKYRSESSLKSLKPVCGRSEVSPIYLLQRVRLSLNSAQPQETEHQKGQLSILNAELWVL